MKRVFAGAGFMSALAASALSAAGQARPAVPAPPDLAGVYQVIPDDRVLPGGLRNLGFPRDIAPTAAARERMKAVDLTRDPDRMCQPVGPFRMMAREGTKIELVPALAHGTIVMIFEDLSHGLFRTIYMNRGHPAPVEPTWLGDSVGRWEGAALVIDTAGFNDRTWLNERGAPHSEALHLVERIRPILRGAYLEYRVNAEDPQALVTPYAYTRYYERLKTEIVEDVCED